MIEPTRNPATTRRLERRIKADPNQLKLNNIQLSAWRKAPWPEISRDSALLTLLDMVSRGDTPQFTAPQAGQTACRNRDNNGPPHRPSSVSTRRVGPYPLY